MWVTWRHQTRDNLTRNTWFDVGTGTPVVNLNQTSILHGCPDMKPQRFWGHDLDLLGSGDAIDHVTDHRIRNV